MARGEDTSKHPNRGVSRHSFSGGGYVDIMRSPELQRDIDAIKEQNEETSKPKREFGIPPFHKARSGC